MDVLLLTCLFLNGEFTGSHYDIELHNDQAILTLQKQIC